jgi:hypothetical protein
MNSHIQHNNNDKTNKTTIDILYKGIIYRVEKDDHESFDAFHQRAWFIAKAEPLNEKEFKEIEIQSHIWRNITYNGVKY